MADLVLSPVLQVILDKLASPVFQVLCNTWNIEENIQRLQRTLPIFEAVLEDVEELYAPDTIVGMGIQLSNLKDVFYDALYLLLDFSPSLSAGNKVKQMVQEIQMVVDKLLELSLSKTIKVHTEWDRGESTSSVKESEVCGRKEDKDYIVN